MFSDIFILYDKYGSFPPSLFDIEQDPSGRKINHNMIKIFMTNCGKVYNYIALKKNTNY